MRFDPQDIENALRPIIGMRVLQLYHAGDMRGLPYRSRDQADEGQAMEWCLHIACTWRLEHNNEIVTGTYDWLQHGTRPDLLAEEWDPARRGSRQEDILRRLLNDSAGTQRTIQIIQRS